MKRRGKWHKRLLQRRPAVPSRAIGVEVHGSTCREVTPCAGVRDNHSGGGSSMAGHNRDIGLFGRVTCVINDGGQWRMVVGSGGRQHW